MSNYLTTPKSFVMPIPLTYNVSIGNSSTSAVELWMPIWYALTTSGLSPNFTAMLSNFNEVRIIEIKYKAYLESATNAFASNTPMIVRHVIDPNGLST